MAGIRAAEPLNTSSLPQEPLSSLCPDYINGFCRRGDHCPLSHLLCELNPSSSQTSPNVLQQRRDNVLSNEPRRTLHDRVDFETDGPGQLSAFGPRHDNDDAYIQNIRILPTTDEILSLRRPYMPQKDGYSHAHNGVARLVDLNFRHLRYDSTEPIIDVCYHASQFLTTTPSNLQSLNYDDRMQTPRNIGYSLFRDVEIFEIQFREARGLSVRVSFSCPEGLRGNKMHKSTCLEEASCLLTFAEPNDLSAARRLLLNHRGLLSERFVLVDFPSVLLPGFSWCLERLKSISRHGYDLPFSDLIASENFGIPGAHGPPQYEPAEENAYNLDSIRKPSDALPAESLTLQPNKCYENERVLPSVLRTIERETTLDEGQAQALGENLCRGLAFTQGPPGTGKTYLGVALVKTLLGSREDAQSKPILVVCMTNHALDSFLDGLRSAGLTRFARLGRGSKELWTAAHSIQALSRRVRQSTPAKKKFGLAKTQVEGLWLEGASLSEALSRRTPSWQAIRSYVQSKDPAIFEDLSRVEHVDETQKLSNLRVARQAGGFAFEYWACGGDLQDIESLINCFDSMFGKNNLLSKKSSLHRDLSPTTEVRARDNVVDQVRNNARRTHQERNPGAWTMPLEDRKALISGWEEEIGPSMIVDQVIEVHRRYHLALSRVEGARDELDEAVLEQQDVIGLTTTACAKFWPKLSKVGFATVICEEAGEVIEAQSLCTLFPSIKHAIFIGDPLQLRAQVNEAEMAMENGTQYRLDQSLFERMMYPCAQGVRPFPTSRLNIQRRMHPSIADLMRATLYPGLKDGENTKKYPAVAGMADRLWWLDHQQPESRPDPRCEFATSYINEFEVDMVHGLVQYLVNTNEYSFGDIAVLTPYNGQLAALNERLSSTCSIWLSKKDKDLLDAMSTLPRDDWENIEGEKPEGKTTFEMSSMLRLATIDNFQGEEAKIVILSTVRSNVDEKVGFLKTPNRINVACSRAKHGFYIIGNASLMRNVGRFTERLQIVLSCSHTFDVQDLDEQMLGRCMPDDDGTGIYKYTEVNGSLSTANPLKCPRCQAQVEQIRRYSSVTKMMLLPQTLDDTYLHFGRDLSRLMKRIFTAKSDLRHTHQAFHNQLKSGPMYGRANQFLVEARVDLLRRIQSDIFNLRDGSFGPFERSMIRLDEFLGSGKLAILLQSSVEKDHGASKALISSKLPLQSNEQPNSDDGHAAQYPSSASDSGVSIDGGLFPDNAITRDIVRRIKERDPLQRTHSSWAIPDRSRPFNSVSNTHFSSNATSGMFVAANLPFKARLESLFYRCRLLMFEESVHMLDKIQAIDQTTDHSKILADGLRTGTINQSQDVIRDIDGSISVCQSKNLKRLEVELRLVQFGLHAVLRSLNTESGVNVEASADIAVRLCHEYPDTAGIFLADCLSVRYGGKQRRYNWKIDLYKRDANTFWKMWAGHEAGNLKHCLFGHPYSAYTFSDCPECGRREEVRETVDVDYSKYLDEDAFLVKMQDRKLPQSPTKAGKANFQAEEEGMATIRSFQKAASQQDDPEVSITSEKQSTS